MWNDYSEVRSEEQSNRVTKTAGFSGEEESKTNLLATVKIKLANSFKRTEDRSGETKKHVQKNEIHTIEPDGGVHAKKGCQPGRR